MTKTYTTVRDLETEVMARIDPRPEHFETLEAYNEALGVISAMASIVWAPAGRYEADVDVAEIVVKIVSIKLGIEC